MPGLVLLGTLPDTSSMKLGGGGGGLDAAIEAKLFRVLNVWTTSEDATPPTTLENS